MRETISKIGVIFDTKLTFETTSWISVVKLVGKCMP